MGNSNLTKEKKKERQIKRENERKKTIAKTILKTIKENSWKSKRIKQFINIKN